MHRLQCWTADPSETGRKTDCDPCPAGKFANPATARTVPCEMCPAGANRLCRAHLLASTAGMFVQRFLSKHCWENILRCLREGTYQSLVGQTNCTGCAAGMFGEHEGSIYLSACTACSAGRYADPSETGRKTDCDPCAGKFANPATARTVPCEICPAGTFASITGSTACNGLCPVGKYLSDPGLSASLHDNADDCEPCAVDTFNDIVGAASCKVCPNGTVQPSSGEDHCKNIEADLVLENSYVVSLLDSIANTTNVSAATDRAKDIATKLNVIDVATVNETQRAELTKLREDIIDSLLSVIGNQTGGGSKEAPFANSLASQNETEATKAIDTVSEIVREPSQNSGKTQDKASLFLQNELSVLAEQSASFSSGPPPKPLPPSTLDAVTLATSVSSNLCIATRTKVAVATKPTPSRLD